MSTQSSTIVQRVWNYCNVLRDESMSYGDYVEQALSVVRASRLRQAVLKSTFEGRLT
jgi:hypothetical protein